MVKEAAVPKEVNALTALRWAIRTVLVDRSLFTRDGLLPVFYHKGASNSRVLVVTGSNASGKSLVSKFMGVILGSRFENDPRGFETFNMGMGMRTQGGMVRAFVFGDEDTSSTGDVSLRAVNGLIRNSGTREQPHLAILDEPDTGLSEDYAAAMGDKIAEFAAQLQPLCVGLIIVSHSRALISRLLPLNPHSFRMGDPRAVGEWVAAGPEPKTVADLDALPKMSLERFRGFAGIMRDRRAARKAES